MSRKFHVGRSELLLNNAIDNNVNVFLRPLNLIQSLFFISSYTIRDNFITYKSSVSYAFGFFSIIVVIFIYVFRVIIYDSENMFVYINVLFDSVYYSLGFTMNLYASVAYKNLNINLVLKIQELKKSNLITHNTLYTLTRLNWIYIVTCFFFYVYVASSFIILFEDNRLSVYSEIICQITLFAFDVNAIYASQIIRILRAALREWLSDLKSCTAIKTYTSELKGKGRKQCCGCSKVPLTDPSRSITCLCVPSLAPKSIPKAPVFKNQWQEAYVKVSQLTDVAKRSNKVDVVQLKATDLTSDEKMENCCWENKLMAYATILEAFEFTKTAFQLMVNKHDLF